MTGETYSWDIDAKKLLFIWVYDISAERELSVEGFNLGGFERVLAALASNCESFLLCVNHSQVLSRTRLYGSKQKSVCDANGCLLT